MVNRWFHSQLQQCIFSSNKDDISDTLIGRQKSKYILDHRVHLTLIVEIKIHLVLNLLALTLLDRSILKSIPIINKTVILLFLIFKFPLTPLLLRLLTISNNLFLPPLLCHLQVAMQFSQHINQEVLILTRKILIQPLLE